ncbi:MAG: NAD-dependent epimerase/dehydratase family protein, partial [Planctomycetota bacterium]
MKCLVTGAGGFIGGNITRRLLKLGHEVVTFQRGNYPELNQLGGTHLQGSITQKELLMDAMKEVDAVFHVAALAAISGPREDFEQANVLGTRNVIEACKANGVQRLIFTSSPSVVFDGKDQIGIDESES